MKRLLIILSIIFAATAAKGQSSKLFIRDGNQLTYKNNRFQLKDLGMKDTIVVQDPFTGELLTKLVSLPPQPVTMNGNRIYDMTEVTQAPQPSSPNNSFENYLLNKLKNDPQICGLKDGNLTIKFRYLVFDETGRIVYYDYQGMEFTEPDGTVRVPDPQDAKIDSIISAIPKYKPAKYQGKNVLAVLKTSISYYRMHINNHHITW